MGYELAEQLDWRLPDWIIYPTGGGTGLIGMWKAFAEMEAIGWIPQGHRPRMVSVQASGCAPIVRAFDQGDAKATPWSDAHTSADGLRVPRAIGDFLILQAVRESGGTALAVTDEEMVNDMLLIGKCEGVSAAPEGGAALAAIRRLAAAGQIKPHETVVLFNTGGALKYLDVLKGVSTLLAERDADRASRRQQVVVERHRACVRPTTSASGTGTMSGGLLATILPNTPATATAPRPRRRSASPARGRRPSARRRAADARAPRSARPCRSSARACRPPCAPTPPSRST